MTAAAVSSRPPRAQFVAVVSGVLLLAAASYVEIPMVPVPITLQTLAVTVIGAVCGPRLALVTIASWLIAGALGLPVLAGGGGGLERFSGPTAGYLFAFPVAGAVVGWLSMRGSAETPLRAFSSMLIGNAICLIFGAAWLARLAGPERAIATGVAPFVIGAILKSIAGALVVTFIARRLSSDPSGHDRRLPL